MVSAALGVVAQLGVADHLADGPRSTPDLAARTGANEDALYRVLRALATTGIFTETSSRTFALTPSGALLRSNVPGSMRDMVLWLCDSFHFRVYAEMAHSVRTGETLGDKLLGMPVFEYLQHNPELAARFNNAMTNFSAGIAPAVLEAYDFGGIDVLVDVAGGHGMLLASVLRKYPSMRGILFDVEHVIAGAKAPEALGVADRCDKVSGDFFKAVPRGGDAYVLKSIIHDWDDEKAGAILRNTRAALEGKPNGKVLLVEAVIKPGNEPDLSKLGDLEMMLLPGGRERTEAEFAALFARNGFQLTRVVPTRAPLWVVEAQVR
jgi:O-methyltransferase domain